MSHLQLRPLDKRVSHHEAIGGQDPQRLLLLQQIKDDWEEVLAPLLSVDQHPMAFLPSPLPLPGLFIPQWDGHSAGS